MKVRPSALILKENTVLTMRYEYNDQSLYNLPGGNLEFGEEMKEALTRELQEELGIKAMITDEPILLAEVHNARGETLHVIFEAKIETGSPELNPAETTALELVWLPLEQLAGENMYPSVGNHIKQWQAGQLPSPHVGVIEQVWL